MEARIRFPPFRKLESTRREGDDQELIEGLETLETEARRMEMKRNGSHQKRTSKRRKLEKLVGWGEPSGEESSLQEDIDD